MSSSSTSTQVTNTSPTPASTSALTVHHHRTLNKFFTPTHLFFSPEEHNASWQSRAARKGRYSPKSTNIIHNHNHGEEGGARMVEARLQHVGAELKPGLKADISFWVAFSFTLGSMVWVVNGFMVWFPIIRPSLATTAFSRAGAGTAFVGSSIFEIGSYLMVVEALDRGREMTFGTALGNLLHQRRHLPPNELKRLEQKFTSDSEGVPEKTSGPRMAMEKGKAAKGWIWWGKPMWHDLGYLAALVQLFAATVFWISTVTGLPGVIPGSSDGEGSVAIVDVFFWTPQVVGGSGFIVSSLILMLEVQTKWYIPKLTDIGWHIGFWNLIGAFGFMLCGAIGYSSASGAVYQSGLSTWWGSWAFLIGSVIQCWEVIWREPEDHSEEKGQGFA